MSKRNFKDWLAGFCGYAQFGEAPRLMYFWVGVSTLAGALRRRVWIDQVTFKWFPNFYIILVAPAGIIAKSTTTNLGMRLLRQVPGVRFGPDIITWPALVTALADSTEMFELNSEYYPMSPMTLEASELGNLLDVKDTQMVDLLVSLWDGKEGAFLKDTKMSGKDSIENPWINIIGCTTPSWIAGNVSGYMVEGGLLSRCVFLYAEQKSQYVPYPRLVAPKNSSSTEKKLVEDLCHIAENLKGEYEIEPEAIEWGIKWYEDHYSADKARSFDAQRFGGYIARKQTHIHKLAMILAASSRDEMVITRDDLSTANEMVTALEPTFDKIFQKVGQGEMGTGADKFLTYIRSHGRVTYVEAYRYIYAHFPSSRDFEDMLAGCIRSGQVKLIQEGNQHYIIAGELAA